MPTLPDWCSLLVRTDFTDDAAWDQVREEATREYGPDGFCASVEPVSDPQWAGAAWEAVKAAAPVDDDAGPCVLFIADQITFASPEHLILVVDLDDKFVSVTEFPEIANRTPFRCITSALWEVENNLSIANLDWEDFAGDLADGEVYRGLELPPRTAEDKADAERRARLEEQQQQLAAELRYWGWAAAERPGPRGHR